jgi:hypothetical protein
MAQDKEIDVKTETTAKKPESKVPENKAEIADQKSKKNLIIIVSILAVVGIGLVITAASFAIRGSRLADDGMGRTNGFAGTTHMVQFDGNSIRGGGRYVSTQVTNDSVTTTVYNYKRGVVVAVNADSIEIAGGGSRTTIKTNSSTVYTNDTKPAVNDTVTVAGTTTDKVITATEITVQN